MSTYKILRRHIESLEYCVIDHQNCIEKLEEEICKLEREISYMCSECNTINDYCAKACSLCKVVR